MVKLYMQVMDVEIQLRGAKRKIELEFASHDEAVAWLEKTNSGANVGFKVVNASFAEL
jgi:hypothetical protein